MFFNSICILVHLPVLAFQLIQSQLGCPYTLLFVCFGSITTYPTDLQVPLGTLSSIVQSPFLTFLRKCEEMYCVADTSVECSFTPWMVLDG